MLFLVILLQPVQAIFENLFYLFFNSEHVKDNTNMQKLDTTNKGWRGSSKNRRSSM